jgi:hypothetical protein
MIMSVCMQLLAIREHLNWELFDHLHYSHDFTRCDYHLYAWLKSKRFSINEFMEGVKI